MKAPKEISFRLINNEVFKIEIENVKIINYDKTISAEIKIDKVFLQSQLDQGNIKIEFEDIN